MIQSLPRPITEDPATGWARLVWYLGPTMHLEELCIHSGVMSANVTPHEIHTHDHEEMHITLSDNIQFTFRDPDSGEKRTSAPESGSLFYLDSTIPHNSQNSGDEPAEYLHIRWRKSPPFANGKAGLHFLYRRGARQAALSDEEPGTIEVYSGPTRFLPRLNVRYHKLSSGNAIPLHRDDHETLIVLVEGSLEILGKTVNAPGFAFMGARIPHNLNHRGFMPARFYGIEFHHA